MRVIKPKQRGNMSNLTAQYLAYKIFPFWNLKAWGELILFLKPEEIVINWPALKDREKTYIRSKIAELKSEGENNHDLMP